MKYFKILLLIFIVSYGSDELYQKALEYEKNGDIKNALKYYKMAYQHEKNNKISNTSKFQEYETDMAKILDLKTHNLNYLLPATYTKNVPNDRENFETKFAFSMKKPLFYNLFGLKESLVVAYSQTSWWQTAVKSTPFRESNYKPEMFINFDLNRIIKYARIGFLHESNGKGGDTSRSWNRVYLQTKLKNENFTITPRIWTAVGDLSDNKNIQKYLGNADITLKFNHKNHKFYTMFRNNLHLDETNRGAVEFGWMFPTFSDGIYGYLQYFNGYGESLIDYNRHTNKIGIGFAILR